MWFSIEVLKCTDADWRHRAGGNAGYAEALGYDRTGLTRIRRAGLLHDLGKLGVSNLILDKPGKLTDDEFVVLKKHPEYSQQILERIGCFAPLAPLAGAHARKVERARIFSRAHGSTTVARCPAVDGGRYFRVLAPARPYREAVPTERVVEILERDSGTALCPTAPYGLQAWLARCEFDMRVATQLQAARATAGRIGELRHGSLR